MKALTLTTAAALGALAIAGATPAAAKPARSGTTCAKLTPAQLDAQFATFNAAWATKNPDTVTKLFDDDAVLLATVAAHLSLA